MVPLAMPMVRVPRVMVLLVILMVRVLWALSGATAMLAVPMARVVWAVRWLVVPLVMLVAGVL